LKKRVPLVRERLHPLFANYLKGDRLLTRLVHRRERVWHARRMARLHRHLAAELRWEVQTNPNNDTQAVLDTKTAAAQDSEAKAESYTKTAEEWAERAHRLRGRLVDVCYHPARLQCNRIIRAYLVTGHRLWNALRNKAMGKDMISRIEPTAESARSGVVQGTFQDPPTGFAALRELRAQWFEIWQAERHRSLLRQTIHRKKLRLQRLWAEIHRLSPSLTPESMNEHRHHHHDKARLRIGMAEEVGKKKIVYHTTVHGVSGRRLVQSSGPNTHPRD